MTIKIGRDVENRIIVSFPYNPYNIVKIKTIEGYRWHPEENTGAFHILNLKDYSLCLMGEISLLIILYGLMS